MSCERLIYLFIISFIAVIAVKNGYCAPVESHVALEDGTRVKVVIDAITPSPPRVDSAKEDGNDGHDDNGNNLNIVVNEPLFPPSPQMESLLNNPAALAKEAHSENMNRGNDHKKHKKSLENATEGSKTGDSKDPVTNGEQKKESTGKREGEQNSAGESNNKNNNNPNKAPDSGNGDKDEDKKDKTPVSDNADNNPNKAPDSGNGDKDKDKKDRANDANGSKEGHLEQSETNDKTNDAGEDDDNFETDRDLTDDNEDDEPNTDEKLDTSHLGEKNEADYDDDADDEESVVENDRKGKPPNSGEARSGSEFSKKVSLDDETQGSGRFMSYFLMAVVFVACFYVIFHNRQKLKAYMLEGRNGRGGRKRKNGNSEYRQLSTAEEVLPSTDKGAELKMNYTY